jgi:hypothetical protein
LVPQLLVVRVRVAADECGSVPSSQQGNDPQ